MSYNCKACGSKALVRVLDMGRMPSANNLVTKTQLKTVRSYPLEYYLCTKCSLFQQVKLVTRKSLFSNYLYLTGVNKQLVAHFKEMTDDLAKLVTKKGLAVVVASNDGTEVKLLEEAGFRNVIGIEPSSVAKIAEKNRIRTIHDFFTYELSERLKRSHGLCDLITANNVFAHIPDPRDMLRGMANLIKDDGIISIEAHWLRDVIKNLEIEALYAEHYFVWDIKSMEAITEDVGLRIAGTHYMPEQHGGSIRFILKKANLPKVDDSTTDRQTTSLKADEVRAGLYKTRYIANTLQRRADKRRLQLKRFIGKQIKAGKTIAIWSVPAKVPTLINFCGLNNKQISCAYEVSPTKIGRYIPKANIQIKNENLIMKDMPDFLIIGAWNYMDVAKEKLKGYMKAGGRLIDPRNCTVIDGKRY